MLRLDEVLEPMEAKVGQLRVRLDVWKRCGSGILRDEDLAAVAGPGDARHAVEVHPDVGVAMPLRLPGMDPHPDAHLGAGLPAVVGQRALSIECRSQSRGGPGKDEEMRVTL